MSDLSQLRLRRKAFISSHSNNINSRYFTFVGQLEKVKSFDLILDFLRTHDLNKSFPIWSKIVIFGEGTYSNELRDLQANNPFVEFRGYQDASIVHSSLSASEFLFLPSQSEGYPRVISEALTLGVPVYASDVGSVPSMLSSCEYSYTFTKPSSALDIYNILASIYNSLYSTTDQSPKSELTSSLAYSSHTSFANGFRKLILDSNKMSH